MQQLVSIITPAYNSAAFIARTINAVIAQTYTHWELIVIDDKSADDTCDVVKQYINAGHNIKLIALPENKGVANARNVGLTAATGKYIAFLDSDDVWLDEKLSIQVKMMEEHNYPMTFCAYHRVNENDKIISGKIPVPKTVNYSQLLWHNVIIFSTSLTLRSAIGDLKFKKAGHEDWIFWLDLFKKCGGGYGINQPLAYYRVRENSISANKLKAAGFTWKIYRENEKIGLLKAAYLFTRYAFATVWKRLK